MAEAITGKLQLSFSVVQLVASLTSCVQIQFLIAFEDSLAGLHTRFPESSKRSEFSYLRIEAIKMRTTSTSELSRNSMNLLEEDIVELWTCNSRS